MGYNPFTKYHGHPSRGVYLPSYVGVISKPLKGSVRNNHENGKYPRCFFRSSCGEVSQNMCLINSGKRVVFYVYRFIPCFFGGV